MYKKIGLGIPTINRADLLNQALEVYKSKWSNRDVCIVDNGNQDIEINSPNQHIIKTKNNLGVSGSWNLICDTLFSNGCTHVAILNDDVIWDKSAEDIEDYIDKNSSDFYIGLGTWCVFIIPLTTWKKIGRFDENFYPAYYEDNDYHYRMMLESLVINRSVFFNPQTYYNSQTIAKNPSLNQIDLNKQFYIKKWGSTPGNEIFTIPYNCNIVKIDDSVKINDEKFYGIVKNKKKVTGFFSDGVKPLTKIFERRVAKITYENIDYNPFIHQPHFSYTGKTYKSKIPLKIFQTWGTKNLLPKMRECVDELITNNPEFEYYLFDDVDCDNFIEQHFNLDVLLAYRKLIPGAFKADLWRYCVLYVHGGIYLDIKYKPFKGFRLIELTENEHFVFDLPESEYGVYNGLMVCKPGNVRLFKAIENIVDNVKNNFYGSSCLSPTGPMLLKNIFLNLTDVDLYFTHKAGVVGIINKDNKFLLYNYPEYRVEQSEYFGNTRTNHYGHLWRVGNIYR
jgi:mannosyltransferase OCH1-like enzyme